MPRLFVAVCPPEVLAQQLALFGGGIQGARWEPAENLHLTVQFIGDVDGRQKQEITEALEELESPAFDLKLDHGGRFPTRGEPRVLWLGPTESMRLAALHAEVRARIESVDIDLEKRRYVPHLTVARLRRPTAPQVEGWIARHTYVDLPRFRVEKVVLFSSILNPKGARYRREAVFRLPHDPATP